VEQVRYQLSANIAEITLERPPVNALNLSLLDGLIEGLRRAGADESVRAVILRSALPGRFCAGLDLDLLRGKTAIDVRRFLDKLYVELADVQHNLRKPSIAAVEGAARGGGMTLAILCDVIIAGEGATFGYPEIELGLLPAIHFVHLPRIVGRHRAFELLFSGRAFAADEALSLGLVSCVLPDDKVREQARALAHAFAAKPRTAMQLGRAAFMRANDYRGEISNAVELFCNIAATEEAQEAIRAFIEKRSPKWS
jgi:enoyl-CoA hydratase/carnithine racemase